MSLPRPRSNPSPAMPWTMTAHLLVLPCIPSPPLLKAPVPGHPTMRQAPLIRTAPPCGRGARSISLLSPVRWTPPPPRKSPLSLLLLLLLLSFQARLIARPSRRPLAMHQTTDHIPLPPHQVNRGVRQTLYEVHPARPVNLLPWSTLKRLPRTLRTQR